MAKSKLKAWLPLFFLFIVTVAPFASAETYVERSPQVGAFYYTWYDPSQTASWEYPKIQDKPVLGYYNSCDPAVIEQHFAWLSDLRMDFIVVSWWGMYNQTDWHSFMSNATMQVFQVARENVTNVKVALMVEPFNESGTYNFSEVYDWVYTNLYQNYPTIYYKVDSKPLLCFFNGQNMTADGVFQRDDRFTVKIVGNDPTAEWLYDCATEKNNPVAPAPKDRQISVSPRFDDYYVRTPNETVDSRMEYLYDQQWDAVLNYSKQNAIDFVTVTSWNEYPERTMIEPHYDATATNHDPFFLCNLTKTYIEEMKGINQEVTYEAPKYWYQNPYAFVVIFGVLILAAFLAIEIYKHY